MWVKTQKASLVCLGENCIVEAHATNILGSTGWCIDIALPNNRLGVVLGWYSTEGTARTELADLHAAIERGERTYTMSEMR